MFKADVIMYTCMISFPVEGLLLTIGSENFPRSLLFLSESCGINSRGNIFPFWTSIIKTGNFFFLLHAQYYRIPSAGSSLKTAFMKKTGVPTSKRPLTALVTSSNI